MEIEESKLITSEAVATARNNIMAVCADSLIGRVVRLWAEAGKPKGMFIITVSFDLQEKA